MGRVTEDALARAASLGEQFDVQVAQMARSIEKANSQAGQLGDSFRQHSEDLDRSSAVAMERMEKLRETQQNATRDTFLRTARVMTEELNSLALDIHNLLDAEIPEEVWRRYREGDRSVFARRLFRMKDSYVIPAIEQRYQRDERFHDMVDRYVQKFEDLLTQSDSADPESILNATFITADVGKLYLVMTRSLGRATEH
jgi:hypothetical protein